MILANDETRVRGLQRDAERAYEAVVDAIANDTGTVGWHQWMTWLQREAAWKALVARAAYREIFFG